MNRDFAVPFPGLTQASTPRLKAALLAALLVGGSVFTAAALAIGMGRPLTQSALGQPLNLLFPVRLSTDETLTPDCVRADVMAGENRLSAGVVQLLLEGDSDTTIRAVRLQSTVQIDEPIVTVNLSLGCPARLTRQFTAFIDPPSPRVTIQVLDSPPVADSVARNFSPALRAALATSEAKPAALLAPDAAPMLVAATSPAPAPAAAPKRMTASTVAPASTSSAPVMPRKAQKDSKSAKQPKTTAPAAAATAVARSGPRLRMDMPEPVEAAVLTASAPQAAAATPPELLLTLTQLEALGQSLTKVQQEQRATEARLLTMRAELEQAQDKRARGERWLMALQWGLALAVLVFAGGCAYLLLSRRRERAEWEQRWWKESRQHLEPVESTPSTPMPVPPPLASPGPTPGLAPLFVALAQPLLNEPDETTMRLPRLEGGSQSDALPGSRFVDSELPVVEQQAAAPVRVPFSFNTVPDRHVTVEELIDLEQQVDFFQVLGQDEAAIELLESRIASGGANALPYLKLLELHQRRADPFAFADLAERFGARFGTLPPTWDTSLSQGHDLESYGAVMQRLLARWSDSADSMALLQNLLSHGDASSGEAGHGFDLPAYRDLLMLYGVARDRSEHEVRSDEIDLFLPLDDTSGEGAALMATMVWQVQPTLVAAGAAELDISLDDALSKH